MAHESEDKFGEKRPARKDQWGNDYRMIIEKPMKFDKKCTDECKDHVTMTWSVEMDVPAISGLEAMMLMIQGQEIPIKKEWTPIIRVLSSYN